MYTVVVTTAVSGFMETALIYLRRWLKPSASGTVKSVEVRKFYLNYLFYIRTYKINIKF